MAVAQKKAAPAARGESKKVRIDLKKEDTVRVISGRDTGKPGRVLRVYHEDVVDDLEGSVRRLLGFCGLEFEPQCVAFHENRRSVRTASSA